MRKVYEVVLKTDRYLAIESLGKLYILRFNGVEATKADCLAEAREMLS